MLAPYDIYVILHFLSDKLENVVLVYNRTRQNDLLSVMKLAIAIGYII